MVLLGLQKSHKKATPQEIETIHLFFDPMIGDPSNLAVGVLGGSMCYSSYTKKRQISWSLRGKEGNIMLRLIS